MTETTMTPGDEPWAEPTPAQRRRWRRYLVEERQEAHVYRQLAARRADGEERRILSELADAESRHEAHWLRLLGPYAENPPRPTLQNRVMSFLARHLGGVFVFALIQRSEARNPYATEDAASDQMAADEEIHGEVVRALADEGRQKLAGSFRAAVFGANDGLVSNLALIIGMSGSGADRSLMLLSGISGLLAGALSMAAGEFVSVRSQRELLDASTPVATSNETLGNLDITQNELELVYRARGMDADTAQARARAKLELIGDPDARAAMTGPPTSDFLPVDNEALGSAWGAALSSFFLFAAGAFVPIVPLLFPIDAGLAAMLACVVVGIALLFTGGVVGLLSGASPLKRGLRQLLIGFGAAGITFLLGKLFGATIG